MNQNVWRAACAAVVFASASYAEEQPIPPENQPPPVSAETAQAPSPPGAEDAAAQPVVASTQKPGALLSDLKIYPSF